MLKMEAKICLAQSKEHHTLNQQNYFCQQPSNQRITKTFILNKKNSYFSKIALQFKVILLLHIISEFDLLGRLGEFFSNKDIFFPLRGWSGWQPESNLFLGGNCFLLFSFVLDFNWSEVLKEFSKERKTLDE